MLKFTALLIGLFTLALLGCKSASACCAAAECETCADETKTISLFNGKDLEGWYADVPDADKAKAEGKDIEPSFIVRDGNLVSKGRPLGHLITMDKFKDYRLVVEYRFAGKQGNCVVLVHTDGKRPRVLYDMFPASIEVQLQHKQAGDFWCIHENIAVPDMATRRSGKPETWGGEQHQNRHIKNLTDGSEKPLGEWNTMIIETLGDKVRVWVNGDLVNDGFDATAKEGQIALQAEGAEVEFRKLEMTPIKELTAAKDLPDAQPKTISLFDGKTLTGWHADIPEADKNPDLKPSFIVRDGNLVSMGRPLGHLITDKSFKDYRLQVEYRFADKPGNCGVLVHASTPRALSDMFPQSIEVQMQSGQAGDFWCIHENIAVPDMEKRRNGPPENYGGKRGQSRHIRNLTDGSEKPLGEWNTMIIETLGDKVRVWVNGDLVNDGFDATAKEGQIALQAEGAEVEFRKLELTPITELTEAKDLE